MRKSFLLLLAFSAFLSAADDPWAKLKEIKGGTELRVFRKGSSQPLLVKMDEATDERLVIVNKNEQTSIPREEIDRIDARPSNKRPVTKESKVTNEVTNPDPKGATGSSGVSTGYSIGGKPDFETVYRRPATPPKK
jgi:hypothetical protein